MFIYFDDKVGKERIRARLYKRFNISENVFTNRIYLIKSKVGIDYLTEINLDN